MPPRSSRLQHAESRANDRERPARFRFLMEDDLGKAELGVKLTCESCGTRFYDLNKQPAKCPKCSTVNARPVVFKARRPSAEDREDAKRAAAAAAAKPAVVAEEEVADPAAAEDDEDEAVIEDTSDLGEDDDDVEVVVEEDP
jgi:uncharacterized protein (TIGR02300 family)